MKQKVSKKSTAVKNLNFSIQRWRTAAMFKNQKIAILYDDADWLVGVEFNTPLDTI